MSKLFDFTAGVLLEEEECVLKYQKGGYHPTYIGDEFNEGQYKIEMKLGHGGFSTVWLAADRRSKTWVSLKILVADTAKGPKELRNIQRISELIPNKPKPWRLCRLEGHFYHEGPNGRHLCLVQELLGPTLRTALDFCHYEETNREYLRPNTVLKISKQLLQTIVLLHCVGIAHGDLRLSNVAFFDPALRKMTLNELIDELGEFMTEPLRMVGGHGPLGPEKPRQLTETVGWNGWNGEDEDDICLIDFGESFYQRIESRHLAQPLHLTVPESVFEDHVDYRADLWRAGTIIYSLVFSMGPFATMGGKSAVVDSMVDFVEKLPPRWHHRWVEERKAVGREAKGRIIEDPKFRSVLEYHFHTLLPDPRLGCLFQVIRGLLRFLPSDRMSAEDALSILNGPH